MTISWSMLIIGMMISLISCKSKHENPQTVSEFEAFYEKFHRDSSYQLDHISFPLEGMPGLLMEKNDSLEAFSWKKAAWKFQQKVDFEAGDFTQKLSSVNGTVIEFICDTDGFCLERRFAKIGRDWFLIYFVDMNFRGNPSTEADQALPNELNQ